VLSGRDVLGEHPRNPQAEVPEVCPEQEPHAAGGVFDIGDDIGEVVILLIAMLSCAKRAAAETELKEERTEIVSETTVVDSDRSQGITNGDIQEQCRRRTAKLRMPLQSAQQVRGIQHPVRPLILECQLDRRSSVFIVTGEQSNRQIDVARGQPLSQVRQNHVASSGT
jgi:hypothetical protein